MRTPRFALAAIALPALCVALARGRGHHGDVAVFHDWYLAARGGFGGIYAAPHADVNYPVLGAAQAVAPGLVLEALRGRVTDGAAFFTATKLALWPWCVALVAAFASAAGALGLARARALAFFALPCAWVGAAYFGQIDGMTAALLLAAASCGARAASAPRDRPPPLGVWLAGLGALCAALLSKQLALFALPGLLALFALALARWRAAGYARPAALALLLGTALGALLLAGPDALLRLPAGARSHLAYVFTSAGPAHGEMIGNAPGLWAFLGRAPDDSARDPFAYALTPHAVGRALFLAYALALTARCARASAPARAPSDARDLAALWVLHAGLTHLAMSLLLAGAHERYAFHAFPLLLLGLGALDERAPARAVARRAHRLAWIAGAVYGLFVLSTIEWRAFDLLFPLRSTQLVATLLFALAVAATHALVVATRSGRPARDPPASPV